MGLFKNSSFFTFIFCTPTNYNKIFLGGFSGRRCRLAININVTDTFPPKIMSSNFMAKNALNSNWIPCKTGAADSGSSVRNWSHQFCPKDVKVANPDDRCWNAPEGDFVSEVCCSPERGCGMTEQLTQDAGGCELSVELTNIVIHFLFAYLLLKTENFMNVSLAGWNEYSWKRAQLQHACLSLWLIKDPAIKCSFKHGFDQAYSSEGFLFKTTKL